MKIKVRSKDANFSLWIPTSLVSSTFIWKNIIKHAGGDEIPLNSEQMDIIFKALKKSVKEYKSLVLVDVESKDGEIVKIVL